jgi:mono/diheme cytochrome c family protein
MMKELSTMRTAAKLLIATLLGICVVSLARADDGDIQPALDLVKEKHNVDIKKLFAAKCSWCHQGMGMKQADGPKLAGSTKTVEQLKLQIRKGKSPMPGFEKQLQPNEIEALADYIKALPTN